MKNEYSYIALFNIDNDGIAIEFPDLKGCVTCSQTIEEGLKDAKEALSLHMWSVEKDKEDIPEPTQLDKIKLDENQLPVLITSSWMPLIRNEIESKAVKKTLTIPQWLNTISEAHNVNFSQLLQAALKEHLNLK